MIINSNVIVFRILYTLFSCDAITIKVTMVTSRAGYSCHIATIILPRLSGRLRLETLLVLEMVLLGRWQHLNSATTATARGLKCMQNLRIWVGPRIESPECAPVWQNLLNYEFPQQVIIQWDCPNQWKHPVLNRSNVQLWANDQSWDTCPVLFDRSGLGQPTWVQSDILNEISNV